LTSTTTIPDGRIGELVRYFLRLGCLGFGGPVALVGQMERELVDDRKWLTKDQMREAIAICQSLPGPLAIQVGVYVAYLRGGLLGRLGRWLGLHPAEFSHRRSAWRTLRLSRRPAAGDRHLLRGQPRCHRTDPAFVLPARQAWHGRLAAMGDRRRVSGGDRYPAGRGGAAVHRRRHRRHFVLRQPSSSERHRRSR